MGTPRFAVPILERLATEHEVVAVYSRPDAASGRGSRLLPTAVKVAAEQLGISVRQPVSLRTPDAAEMLRSDAPTVIVVAAYGLILPPEILAIPVGGCVNVHASLLPKHRGAAPVHRAILEGDEDTGVSIMQMEEGLDTGPFALQRSIRVGDLDADALTERLADLGAEAIIDVLRLIEAGEATWTAQDDSSATYAAKVTRSDVALEPALSVTDALRRVRASTRQATSRILVDGFDIAVLHARESSDSVQSGLARRSLDGLLLGMSDGTVLVDRMRLAGKAAVDGASWARGSRLSIDTPWSRT